MNLDTTSVWKVDATQQLVDTLSDIHDPKEMQNFLRDVLTEKEITEISARLEAAKMLKSGKKYSEIIEATKLSSRTIARISEWMKHGTGGYEIALKKLANKQ